MYLQALVGMILAATVIQFGEAAVIKTSCTMWVEVGLKSDIAKDQFLTRKKVGGKQQIYKYDGCSIDSKVIAVKMSCDEDVNPLDIDGYEVVPEFVDKFEGQSIGGFSGMCKTKKRRVCHLKKCRRYRGKTYCIKKCRNEKIDTCF